MPEFVLRAARGDDLPAVIALLADDPLGETREAPGEGIDPAYQAAFDAIQADPNQLLAVADVDGRVLGCLQLSFIPGLSHAGAWRGQIESVRVASDARGTGLGRQMIDWAIEQCRQRGCRIVQLTSDKQRPDALAFYRALGFEATHEGFKLHLDRD